jgi:hypothetical protein
MSEAAGEESQPSTPPAASEVDPDWFKQIPFDRRRGFDSVLPMTVPILPHDFGEEDQV